MLHPKQSPSNPFRKGAQQGALAWVSTCNGRRVARCTCEGYGTDGSCWHIWIVALIQASLNRLGLRFNFWVDFDSEEWSESAVRSNGYDA
jgi:hypothetical protein